MSVSGSNPEYVTARVKARESALYGDEEYRKLVRMTPAEIARLMEESDYEREINALGSRYSGVDLIEYALNQNLARQFDDLLRWANGRLYDLIARYLRKFDAWNVKTLIRGIYSVADADTVDDDLIRAGEFDDELLDNLLDVGSIEEIVERLSTAGTIYGSELNSAYDDYDESGVLIPLENAVDRTYYEQLLADLTVDEATAQYREFLEAEIDFRNVQNAFRLAQSGADIDPAAYYIDGGSLFTATELTTLAQNRNELIEAIRGSRYGDDLSEALNQIETADSLIQFERALDNALLEYSDTLGTVHPLSVTPVVSYILAKEREVDNIRAIARGREAGLSDDEIEQEFVQR
jgi:V/A-type H+-transporting ATPase subunit C